VATASSADWRTLMDKLLQGLIDGWERKLDHHTGKISVAKMSAFLPAMTIAPDPIKEVTG
jgi:hypothetical protein